MPRSKGLRPSRRRSSTVAPPEAESDRKSSSSPDPLDVISRASSPITNAPPPVYRPKARAVPVVEILISRPAKPRQEIKSPNKEDKGVGKRRHVEVVIERPAKRISRPKGSPQLEEGSSRGADEWAVFKRSSPDQTHTRTFERHHPPGSATPPPSTKTSGTPFVLSPFSSDGMASSPTAPAESTGDVDKSVDKLEKEEVRISDISAEAVPEALDIPHDRQGEVEIEQPTEVHGEVSEEDGKQKDDMQVEAAVEPADATDNTNHTVLEQEGPHVIDEAQPPVSEPIARTVPQTNPEDMEAAPYPLDKEAESSAGGADNANDTNRPIEPMVASSAASEEAAENVLAPDEPRDEATVDQPETSEPVTMEVDQVDTPAASSLVPEEEGEEELDDDTMTSEHAVEMDVDMDGSSATQSEASTPKGKPAKKKPGPKPKQLKTVAVTAAAKKAAKVKKIETGKSKSKAPRSTSESTHPASASVATAEMTRQDSNDSTTDRVWCICRKRESDDDENITMVGCESCDDWFHPACVGLSEDQVANLDVYICRSCERGTKQKTIYKKNCKRDGCSKGLGNRASKYCSDLCAYKHMKAVTDALPNKKTMKQLASSFAMYPKPTSVTVINHSPNPAPEGATTQTQDLLAAIKSELASTQGALTMVRKRQVILQKAIDHAESLPPMVIQAEESRGSKSKRKAGGPTEDKQCAWDPVLIWDDPETLQWAEDRVPEVCELPRRRCDKHQGWHKTIARSLEVEERQLSLKLEIMGEQEEAITKSAEATAEGEKARKAFTERLAVKGKA